MSMRIPLRPVTLIALLSASLAACSGKKAESAAGSGSAGGAAASGAPADSTAVGTGDTTTLIADYRQKCSDEATPSSECDTLRGLLVAEMSTELQLIEQSGDQRGVSQAIAALDIEEEPALTIAAYRILGHFPQTPGIVEKVLPQLLGNPYLAVQHMAANLLSATHDPAGAEAADLWLQNHNTLQGDSVYEEYPDFPAGYAAMNFPKYPGAEWFSPGDTDRAIGWTTRDEAATVTKWFADTLHTEGIGAVAWMQQMTELALQGFDQTKAARMQQLVERAVKGDQAAAAELEKMQKEMEDASNAANAATEKSVGASPMPPASAITDARWFVAHKKGARISRAVVVYPLPGLKRTVIQTIWDLSDFPSAWPQ
jgi:hypothetical protein